MVQMRSRLLGFAVMVALVGAFAFSGFSGSAQDATPVAPDATPPPEDVVTVGHPAHIHTGTCENLGPVEFPLADVVMTGLAVDDPGVPDATPPADGDMTMGDLAAIPAMMSVTNVDASLSDILAAEHAINVHLSPEQIDIYIACGGIGGVPDENGNLIVGLAEVEGSGYSGIGWLHDNMDGTTTVTIFLALGLSTPAVVDVDPAATPPA